MKNKLTPIIAALGAITLAGSASAATTFTNKDGDGSIMNAANWSNGLPAAGNDGTIALDSNSNKSMIFNRLGASTVQFTAGTLTQTGARGRINLGGGATWSVEGGAIHCSGYLLISEATINVSSGSVTTSPLKNISKNYKYGYFGTTKTGQINISDSGVISTKKALRSHRIDFATGWTGSWTVSDFTSAADWKALIVNATSPSWTYNGKGITTNTEFDAVFNVSTDGKTLSIVPNPSSAALLTAKPSSEALPTAKPSSPALPTAKPSSAALLGLGGFSLILRPHE